MAMSPAINVAIPQELAFALKMQEQELAREVLKLSVIKLYELGKLSSGIAAQLLGITRLAFFELAAEYKVSVFGNPSSVQIEQDFLNA
jgi:predicted HTH domain antitoxin